MKIALGAMAFVFSAGLTAVGLAGPASAEDLEGTYLMQLGVGDPATWNITPCEGAPVEPFVQCVHVAETGSKFAPWQGDAHWQVGSWTMVVDRTDAISCDDGSTLPARVTYSWDATTLAGWEGFHFPGGCGGAPVSELAGPFTLYKR